MVIDKIEARSNLPKVSFFCFFMGYYLKTTNHSDLAELESGFATTISTFLNPLSNSLRKKNPRGETATSLFDLNLGRLGDSGDNNNSLVYSSTTAEYCGSSNLMESSLTSMSAGGSSRRSRAPSGGGNQVVSCLVDGCESDLIKCRDYHRRHKVCEQHSKTPRVTIGGVEQRFCQQCSRFHSLGEFDEGKRSCRKRLEGHNRRRRKPQPDSRSVNPGSFLSGAPGSRFLPYNNSSIIPATSVVNSTWATVKPETDTSLLYSSGRSDLNVLSGQQQQQQQQQQSSVPTSYAYSNNRGRQFPFFQDSTPLTASSTHQPFHDSINGGSSGSNNNPKNFFSAAAAASVSASSPNGFNNQVMNSDRALSLLSSSPPSEAPEIGLGRMVHQQQSSNQVHTARPLITGLHYSNLGQYHHHHHSVAQGLDVHGPSDGGASLISNVFQPACSDGPSSSGPHQTISFSWE